MSKPTICLWLALAVVVPCTAQEQPPLIAPDAASAIAAEISGAAAKRTVQSLSIHHRMRGSGGYNAAADHIRDRLSAYGLRGWNISSPDGRQDLLRHPALSSAWTASFAELWEGRSRSAPVGDSGVRAWADQPDTFAGQRRAVPIRTDRRVARLFESELCPQGCGNLVLISDSRAAAGFGRHRIWRRGYLILAQKSEAAWW